MGEGMAISDEEVTFNREMATSDEAEATFDWGMVTSDE
jgi:hypothetical protein